MPENKVKEFRERVKLSQVELARRAQISQANLCAVERGRLLPSANMRKRLSRVLKASQEELFPGRGRSLANGRE